MEDDTPNPQAELPLSPIIYSLIAERSSLQGQVSDLKKENGQLNCHIKYDTQEIKELKFERDVMREQSRWAGINEEAARVSKKKLVEMLESADEEIRLLVKALESKGTVLGERLEVADDVPDMSQGSFLDRYFDLEKARGAAWPEDFERDVKASYKE